MCWSGQASGVMAGIGFGGSIYAKLKNEHWFRWIWEFTPNLSLMHKEGTGFTGNHELLLAYWIC